jgi:hypothetical protein
MSGTTYSTYNTTAGFTQDGDLFVQGGVANYAFGSVILTAASIAVVNTGLATVQVMHVTPFTTGAGTTSPANDFAVTLSGAFGTIVTRGTSLTGTAITGTLGWVAYGV